MLAEKENWEDDMNKGNQSIGISKKLGIWQEPCETYVNKIKRKTLWVKMQSKLIFQKRRASDCGQYLGKCTDMMEIK